MSFGLIEFRKPASTGTPSRTIRAWLLARKWRFHLRAILVSGLTPLLTVLISKPDTLAVKPLTPRQQLAGQRARRRAVEPEEPGQPCEMLACVLGGDGDHGDVEVPSDHLGDVADRDALVGDRVQGRSRGGRLDRETEQAGGIQSVHGGSAGGARAHVAPDPVVAGGG